LTDHVAHWGALFDELYAGEGAADDPTFDVSGWRSTFTGEPLPAAEMREWLADTVDRLLALRPRRVLEIGCGTGLLVFRLAPCCESYLATDVSRLALERVGSHLGPLTDRVRLEPRPADDLSGIAPGSLDLVILNSVVQYFPDLAYLERVLAGVLRAVRPGGAVFLGDVRSAPLLPAFYTALETAGAGADADPAELRRRVRERARRENELAVDPAFFAGLATRYPGIGRVEVCLKRGRARNELTAFRYQVLLRIGGAPSRAAEVEWLELDALRSRLAATASGDEVLGVRILLNARIDATAPGAVDPWELEKLAADLGWEVELGAADHGPEGRFDAVFRRPASAPVESPAEPLAAWLPPPVARDEGSVPAGWNATAVRFAESAPVHRLVARRAAERPQAPALATAEGTLSFGDVDALTSQLARHLRRLGVRRGVRVGLCLEHPVEAVLGMLAVWKAGGAWVPLDPALPPGRLAFFLADSRPAVLLAREELLAGIDRAGARLVDPERDAAEIAAEPPEAPDGGAGEGDAAYLLYTSGSTGTPKAVLVAHAQLANTLLGARRRFGFVPGDTALALAPFSFDIFLFETFAPLLAGACVRLLARSEVLDLAVLAAAVEAATVVHAVPSLLRQIVGGKDKDLKDLKDCKDDKDKALRLFTGGDLVPPDLLDEARASFPGATLTVLYGPTETSILAACAEIGAEVVAAPLVGRPLDNATLWLLDEAGDPVAVGAAGEICIGGAGVSLGYWRRPALTAERFVPDPFAGSPGARLYRSGDLGRLGAEGHVEFLGRLDRQVKIRGVRVETGEVEAVLRTAPGVAETAVVVREDGGGDVSLAAFWVASPDAPAPGDEALRSHLAARLPAVMIPAALVRCAALPLTPHGKVDRRALARAEIAPAGAGAGAGGGSPAESPRTPAEEILAGLWQEVLGTGRIGVHDGFLDLGGHSLLAARLVRRAREVVGVQLPLRRLLAGASIAELAHGLETARRGAVLPPVVPVPRDGPQGRLLDLSFGQQRLWFLDRLAGGGTAYNLAFALRLEGRLDRTALGRTWDALVARHEILRTTFALGGERPVQVIAPAAPHPLPRLDLRALPPAAREAELARVLRAAGSRPFDLEHGPLFRTLLFDLSAEESALAVANHHAIFDDHSAVLLARELSDLYRAFTSGRPSPLPPLAVQYADFAAWQRSLLTGERLERELVHWRRALGSGEPARLRPDHPRGASPSRAAESTMPPLAAPVLAALRDLGRCEGATLFMTLLAAFQALLHRWTGADRVTAGTPVATRPDAVTEALPGFFLNTLALAVDCGGAPTFRQLLQRTREAALEAYAHQEVPFEKVVEAVQPDRRSGLQPLFQAFFQVRTPWPSLDLPGLRIRPVAAVQGDQGGSPFDLAVSLEATDEALLGGAEYDAALFEASTLTALLADFRQLLEAVAADPDLPLAALPVHGDRRAAILATLGTEPVPSAPGDDGEEERRARLAARKEGLSGARRAALSRLLRGKGSTEGKGNGAPSADVLPRRPAGVAPVLSFAQERLWLLDRLEPGSAAYNMLFPLRLRGSLAAPVLEAALGGILHRHEALRATFPMVPTFPTTDGGPVQVIAPAGPHPLPRIDLAALPAPLREAEARRLTAAELARPFDLAAGPLVRTALLQLGDGDQLLLWNAHHIVFDGWSLGVLLRELGALYAAARAGAPSPLPPLPVQYADFAAWQRGRLQGEVLARELAWWHERLAGAPPVLDLPADRPRPARPSGRGGRVAAVLPRATADRLAALARGAGATLFMLLLAAFDILLGRLAGETDLVVGTPLAGRTRAETEGLIGFFVNTLVLRLDLSGEPSFRELLGRAREVALEAYAHQEVPFEKLVEELAPRRDLSSTPLFQVFFNLVNLGDERLDLPGLTVEPVVDALDLPAKFDLTLYAAESSAGLAFTFLYAADLFDRSRMEALAEAFVALLEQVAVDADRAVGAYPLPGPPSIGWLDPIGPIGPIRPIPLPALIHAAALRDPGRTAVTFPGGSWTYGELLARSGGVASHLETLGAGRGDVVALSAVRGPGLVAAILGVLERGAAFLVLDRAWPAPRREEMVLQARPKAILDIDVAVGADTCPVRIEGSVDDLAYVAFTSGSEGKPKGILGTQRPVLSFLDWYRQRFGLGPEDRFALLSGLAHDPLLRDLLTPLVLGARLAVPSPDLLAEPSALRAWLAAEGVTVLHLTPSLADFLFRDAPPAALPAVRLALFGGELLTWAQAARFRAVCPGAAVANVYGATETPQVMSFYLLEGERTGAGRVPVGRGRDGVDLQVLNRYGGPCGTGELGEIVVRTADLTLGYLNDPARTAERFRPDANDQGDPGVRVYRTGDLGRHRPDGAVEVAGRADAQLKIRGHRIEPVEIETVLAGHPEIREAAVAIDSEGRLTAWLVPQPGTSIAASSLRTWLLARLPEPMVPAEYLMVESLPRTPNGKLDRRALPVFTGLRDGAAAGPGPRDVLEMELARLWEELLGGPVGVRDDFFERGGHSLLGVRLLAEVRRRFGRELPLAALFQAPTVERMAVLLRQEGAVLPASGLVPIRPGAESGVEPGAGRPLFCVHPAGGNVTCYAALARALDGRPVWAFEARGLAPGDEPRTSIEEMAAAYVDAMRSVQPAGPYALLGWSLGGLIAWEMARQLAAQGDTVEPLALLDTWGRDRLEGGEMPPDADVLLGALEGLFTLPPEELAAVPPDERFAFILRRARDAGALPPDFGLDDARRYLVTYRANARAAQTYRPGTWPGRAVLFRAAADFETDGDEARGWDERAEVGLTVVHVPGTHRTMIDSPHVEAVAAWLVNPG
jgi:amino acid adenylation domain-containing protein